MSKKEDLELDLSSDNDNNNYLVKIAGNARKLFKVFRRMRENINSPSVVKTPADGKASKETSKEAVLQRLEEVVRNEEKIDSIKNELQKAEEKIRNAKKEVVINEIVEKVQQKEEQKTETEKYEEPEKNLPDVEKIILDFPKGFLWGTATSAYQIEGGNHNNWSEWEQSPARQAKLRKEGLNSNDFICGQACDSYNRYEEDLELAHKLNTNAIRFGIEWSRIEPKEGVWDVEAIKHYRLQVEAAKKKGFSIVLTLWHWTDPVWIRNQGGWTNKKTIENYLKYVEVVVKELGTYVDYWITLNEPLVPVGFGYLIGAFPPGRKLKLIKAVKAVNNLAEANNRAYDIIHDHFPDSLSSVTMLSNYNMPARRWCPVEWAFAKLTDYFSTSIFLNKIKDSMDFIGLDTYKMNRIVWYPPFKRNKRVLMNEMGWEVYPEGIYHMLIQLSRYNLPILITENGTADSNDSHRAGFIRETLKYVHKALGEGADVRGYFHWSLLDNFEWAYGYRPKFGLYRVDRETFWRSKRGSADVYREICKNNVVEVDKR